MPKYLKNYGYGSKEEVDASWGEFIGKMFIEGLLGLLVTIVLGAIPLLVLALVIKLIIELLPWSLLIVPIFIIIPLIGYFMNRKLKLEI